VDIALVAPASTFLTTPMMWPPLGLWYLAAQLECSGHRVWMYDRSMDDTDVNGSFGSVSDGDYDQVWITATAPQMSDVRRIGEITKDWRRTRTVLGGPAVWAAPEMYKGLPFDLLVAGEGDHPDTIKEILYRAGYLPGMFHTTQAKDLEWVLPPVRRWARNYMAHLLDRSDGTRHWTTSLFTARGCPCSCAFCESGRLGVIWGSRTRYEPLWSVEQQIRESRDLGFTGLAFYDDIFILNKHRTDAMLEIIKKYDMKWRCFLRSDILSKHGGRSYLKRMRDSGLVEVFVGVESASNQIKENINKGTTIEQDESVLAWCKELDITCKMSFIFGLPGESLDTMKITLDWILEHRPHIVQVDRLIPFPGTPLVDNMQAYDLTYDNQPDDEWFFRGKFGIGSRSFVKTSHLSVNEIDEFWHYSENILREEGL
jgi:anaerobic magnesium-protoporphyrin IX monomethyl ester cyclase